MSSNKFVCIHGHFYQPPRENPWLETIEVQDSAYPYRDWNERITAECYNPNTAARIKKNDKVVDIVNNYSMMSFNFGPTLLSWMEAFAPEVYQSILNADREGMERFSGHGTAIAQVYNHIIMPLSNRRDKITSIIWGIEDFKFRFKRIPEGMWLSETAVDNETLELLAEYGIKYTILAPHQAGQIKKIEDDEWIDVGGGQVDPKRAYVCHLSNGSNINIFYYDGPISQELAFGDLMKDGAALAERLISTFREDEEPQIAHIATDGETYGHHSRYGDMALAYCLNYFEENDEVNLTNYGEFLEKFPPEYETKIIENTSWSCVHGVERWRSNCGCNSGRGWQQEWRRPLREALDFLRDIVAPLYEERMREYHKDPWKIRDAYIKIILNREPSNLQEFFKENGVKIESDKDRIIFLKLMEMERHCLLMYTSCGWFFDEISGLETVQVIFYAGRVIQLAHELFNQNFEDEFVKLLEKCKSNIPDIGNGANAYNWYVKAGRVDLLRLAAHYAVSSLFEEYNDNPKIFSYEVFREKEKVEEAGKIKMIVGKARMRSQITYEDKSVSFCFIHLGDHNLFGGVREFMGEEAFNAMNNEMLEAFQKVNVADLVLLLDKHFQTHNYSLQHLFSDERRKIFNILMQTTLEDAEVEFRQVYENHYPLILAMKENMLPIPKAIMSSIEFVLNNELKKELNKEELDYDKLNHLKDEIKKWGIEIDQMSLSYAATKRINNLAELLSEDPDNVELVKKLELNLSTMKNIGIQVDSWKAQNVLFLISKDYYSKFNNKIKKGNHEYEDIMNSYNKIENYLELKTV